MNNQISVVGTIATEPRIISTSNGASLCVFRVASGDRRYDRAQEKWVDLEPNWFGVLAFRSLADHAIKSFRKGERVVIMGRLRIRQWEKDGKSGTSVDIEADALGHDLRWGISRFEKRTGGESLGESPREDSEGAEAQSSWIAPPADPSIGSFGGASHETDESDEEREALPAAA